MTRDAFDAMVAASDTAMVIVTAVNGEDRSGCLVGFHCQSSIDPRGATRCGSRRPTTPSGWPRAPHIWRSTSSTRDIELAELFGGETGDEVDKFALVRWEPGPGGVPLLTDCPSRVVVRTIEMNDLGGDHVCFEGEPIGASDRAGYRPLRYTAVMDMDPGHEAD